MEEELCEIKKAIEKEKYRQNKKIQGLKSDYEIKKKNMKKNNEKKNKSIEEKRENNIKHLIKMKKNLEENHKNYMNKSETKLETAEQDNKKQIIDKYSNVKFFSLKEDEEKIKKLIEENRRLLKDVKKNQNEINNIEMNFGHLFFKDKEKIEIQQEGIKLKIDYDNFLRKKQADFDNYINDKQMINFFELGKNNSIINSYVVPQIAFEFYYLNK